jgi:salicylate hydroxylase
MTDAEEYAYRNLFTGAEADQILGHERTDDGNIYCSHETYVVTFPVDHSRLMNMTAIWRKELSWGSENWLVPTSREAMLEDFCG